MNPLPASERGRDPERDEERRIYYLGLPKTETHLHIEGALPWRLLHQLDPVRFAEPPAFWEDEYRFSDFAAFEEPLLAMAMAWYNSPERYHIAAKEVFRELAEQNVRYVETSFASGILEFLGLDGAEVAEAIHTAAPHGMTVRVFLGIHHNGFHEGTRGFLEDSLSWGHLHGIDLHGDESLPMEPWTAPFYHAARTAGLFTKAHAGELLGAEFVWRVLRELEVTRIEHGVRSSEDPALVAHLAKTGVALDVCPVSNVKLRVAPSLREHPLAQLHAAGVTCTLNTDDPLVFGNHLTEEYVRLEREGILSRSDLTEIARNGFKVALLPEADKERHLRDSAD